jgi:hypothetical protein
MALILLVLILDLLPKGLLFGFGLVEFFLVFLLNCVDHVLELLDVVLVGALHLFALEAVLVFEDGDVPTELLLQAADACILNRGQVLDVDEVVAEGHLELVFGLVQVLIDHLDERFLRVQLPLIVLRVDVDFVFELLGLGDPHNLPPVSEELLLVEVHKLVLVLDLGSQDVPFDLRQFLQLNELVVRLGDVPDLDLLDWGDSAWPRRPAFEGFAQQAHTSETAK